MKALAISIFTFFACLIVLDLFAPSNSPSTGAAAYPPAQSSAFQAALPAATSSPADAEAQPAGARPTVVAAASINNQKSRNVPVSSGQVAGASGSTYTVFADAAPAAVDAPGQVSIPSDPVAPVQANSPAKARVKAAPALSPELANFAQNMTNGQVDQVVGVFVQNQFALPVVQQPEGQTNYVAVQNNTVTQFGPASGFGTIGLLAHNFLSGQRFFNLKQGQDIFIVYGDGRVEDYRISQVQQFQALDPSSPYSNFVDPFDASAKQISAGSLFNMIYAHSDQVVLQTCIEKNGDSSWGRLFVTAKKVQ